MTAWLLVMLIALGNSGHTVVREVSSEAQCKELASKIASRVNEGRTGWTYHITHTCVEFQK